MEGRIEDTVTLDINFPSVTERYWTKHYFIPKDKRWQGGEGEKGPRGDGGGEAEDGSAEKQEKEKVTDDKRDKEKDGNDGDGTKNDDGTEKMEVEYASTNTEEEEEREKEEGGASGHPKPPDRDGHVCIMVHTNKLCLVTLSPKHSALAPGMEITKVSYNVGKFNRLDNQVSGKGKRGAQMMGPQSPVCIITCADGSQHTVLAGVHGKLVEVNERLLTNPKLLSERPDAEGYLAVILPPLRNGDGPLKRLLTAEQYWGQER